VNGGCLGCGWGGDRSCVRCPGRVTWGSLAPSYSPVPVNVCDGVCCRRPGGGTASLCRDIDELMLSMSATDSEGRVSRPAPYDPTNHNSLMAPLRRDAHQLVARTGTRTPYQPTRLAQKPANPASALQRVSPPEAVPTAVLTESSTVQDHASPAAIKPMAGPQASCHPTRLPHKPYPSASDHQQVSLHEAAPTAVLIESPTVLENTDITAVKPIAIGSTTSLRNHSEHRVESPQQRLAQDPPWQDGVGTSTSVARVTVHQPTCASGADHPAGKSAPVEPVTVHQPACTAVGLGGNGAAPCTLGTRCHAADEHQSGALPPCPSRCNARGAGGGVSPCVALSPG